MPSSRKRKLALPIALTALCAFSLWFILSYGVASIHRVPQWTLSGAMMRLSLEQDPSAGAYYDRTKHAPLPLAAIVRELREAWSDQSIAIIHGAALEVGTALLHRSDIQMGEMVDGKFVPFDGAPWHANEKMIAQVKSSAGLFENDRIYVFRRR